MMGSTTITIIGSAVLALLLAGYIVQKRLPPPKPRIVGIDLGTTYSGVGVYVAGIGDAQVIHDAEGRKTIPSVVHFRSNSEVVIGYEALANVEKDSTNVLYDAKRFIGKTFSLDELNDEAKNYNFKVLNEDGKAYFEVLSETNVTRVSPEEVGCHIIRHLKNIAEENISRPINMAVMSVPADFNEAQRNHTKYAAKLAGIDVLRIINEPTAAALAYGLHKRNDINYVMVIDIGGGTSDVSLLNIQGGMFITMAMAGNNHLGGQDFNLNLYKYLEAKIDSEVTFDWKNCSENLQTLRTAVEKLKLELSSAKLTSLSDLNLKYFGGGGDARTKRVSYSVTRKNFEDLNSQLFDKIIELLRVVLDEVNLKPSEIDEVVLVGGSTRIPRVRQIIGDYFNIKPNTAIDPETAVIQGVSLQAGIITGMWPLKVSAIEIQRSGIKKKMVV